MAGTCKEYTFSFLPAVSVRMLIYANSVGAVDFNFFHQKMHLGFAQKEGEKYLHVLTMAVQSTRLQARTG